MRKRVPIKRWRGMAPVGTGAPVATSRTGSALAISKAGARRAVVRANLSPAVAPSAGSASHSHAARCSALPQARGQRSGARRIGSRRSVGGRGAKATGAQRLALSIEASVAGAAVWQTRHAPAGRGSGRAASRPPGRRGEPWLVAPSPAIASRVSALASWAEAIRQHIVPDRGRNGILLPIGGRRGPCSPKRARRRLPLAAGRASRSRAPLKPVRPGRPPSQRNRVSPQAAPTVKRGVGGQ